MANFMAAMLDELMGKDRDLAPTEKRREIYWDDPEVCKFMLCGFCPHELFVNTRADLGPCEKIHDEEHKKLYEKSSRHQRMGYEEDFLRYLQGLLSDVERRIRRGHQRLQLNSQQGGMNNITNTKEEKIDMLTSRISELVEQAEQLGCEGKVEEAQGVMKLCEQLRDEKAQLESTKGNNVPSLKEMEVCDICGAFLVVGDAQQRLEEHLMGKQHMGYAKVRSTIEDLKKHLRGEDPEREARLAKEREEREKEREKEREERRKRQEEKEKEREKAREERRKREKRSRSRSRHRSHSRSRERGKRRSRSRDRRRRSRSNRRSRSRHRTRSNSRERRRRSRSRDRRRRSRSRSRGRHRRRRSGSSSRSRHHSRGRRSRSRESKSSRDKDRDHKSKDKDKSRDRSGSPADEGRGRSRRDSSDKETATNGDPRDLDPKGNSGDTQGDSN